MREGNAAVKEDRLQIEVRRSSCVENGLFRCVLLRFLERDVREISTGIVVSKRIAMIWSCALHVVVAVAHTDCDCYNRHDGAQGYGERKD